MELNLVLRAAHSAQPVTELIKSGAIPSEMMQASWRAMDRIKVIASRFPDDPFSASGTQTRAHFDLSRINPRCQRTHKQVIPAYTSTATGAKSE